jgi:hypothetical protein
VVRRLRIFRLAPVFPRMTQRSCTFTKSDLAKTLAASI